MSKERVIIESIKWQLRNAIEDATRYLDEAYFDDDLGIYEGRKELAEQILDYLEENYE